jgi:hypothetical protein
MATPRAANRYLNAIRFAVPMLKGELDIVDLLVIEQVRVTLPSVYRWISHNKALLAMPSMTIESANQLAEDLVALDESVNGLAPAQATRAKAVISELFPRARARWNVFGLGSGSSDALIRQKRLASSSYFDRYFLYAVPPGDVADAEITKLVQRAEINDTELAVGLDELVGSDRGHLVITKLRQRTVEIRPEVVERLLLALGAVGTRFDFNTMSVFALGTGEEAAALAVELVGLLPTEERAEIADAFARAAEPLEFSVQFFRWISNADDSKPILSDSEVDRVRALVVARIVESNAREPLFLTSPEWAARLYLLVSKSSSGHTLEEALRTQVIDVATAAAFVRSFMTRSRNLETGRTSLNALDVASYGPLASVLESSVVEALFSEMADGSEPEDRHEDMTHADAAAVARNFMRVAREHRAASDNEPPGEPQGDSTGTGEIADG